MNEWMDQAKCRIDQADPELFFPNKNNRRERGISAQTKLKLEIAVENFCSQCPVRLECFDFAVKTGSEGVWGGELIFPYTRDTEKDKMRRRIIAAKKRGAA